MSTLSNIFGTVVIILLASYIRNCHFNLPLHRKNLTPGGGGIFNYTIKILYVGNMPVILFISFINNIFIISQNMSSRYKKVSLVKILGVWKSVGENTGAFNNQPAIEIIFIIIFHRTLCRDSTLSLLYGEINLHQFNYFLFP